LLKGTEPGKGGSKDTGPCRPCLGVGEAGEQSVDQLGSHCKVQEEVRVGRGWTLEVAAAVGSVGLTVHLEGRVVRLAGRLARAKGRGIKRPIRFFS
jgi:hypothetical protein